jgi:thiol-disulfide isomerase/thioredoxin
LKPSYYPDNNFFPLRLEEKEREGYIVKMSSKMPVIVLILVLSAILYLVFTTSPNLFNRTDLQGVQLVEADIGRIQERIKASSSKVKLVNMWATWCAPCIAEFPYLLQLREEFSAEDFDLILISADVPSDMDKVRDFLAERSVQFETYLKIGDDLEFIEGIHEDWSGGLPATVIYNAQNEIVNFWVGDATLEEFKERVQAAMTPQTF